MMELRPGPMIARDLVGYGEFPPNPRWPGDALIAVNFNLNVEGGGEASLVRASGGLSPERKGGSPCPA
jgi:allantoinase